MGLTGYGRDLIENGLLENGLVKVENLLKFLDGSADSTTLVF